MALTGVSVDQPSTQSAGEGELSARGFQREAGHRDGSAGEERHSHHVEEHPSLPVEDEASPGVAESGAQREEGCARQQGESHRLEEHPPQPEYNPDRQPVEHEEDEAVDLRELVERRQVERVNSGSSGFSSLLRPCEKCSEAQNFLSEKSRNLWQMLDSERCCNKLWCKFLEELRTRYSSPTDKRCLQHTGVLNLLKHILGVPYADEFAKVTVEKFVDAERFFGPFVLDEEGRCFFLRNVEELFHSSTSKKGRKMISWFAGRLSRNNAEELLAKQKKGTFLVRMSETKASEGSFVISVVVKEEGADRWEHFEIEGNPTAAQRSSPPSLHLRFRGEEWQSLPEAVSHLRREGISIDDDSAIRLNTICPGHPLEQVFSAYSK